MIRKELGFIYIVNDKKFTTKKEAEEYAQQKSKVQETTQKEKEFSSKEI